MSEMKKKRSKQIGLDTRLCHQMKTIQISWYQNLLGDHRPLPYVDSALLWVLLRPHPIVEFCDLVLKLVTKKEIR